MKINKICSAKLYETNINLTNTDSYFIFELLIVFILLFVIFNYLKATLVFC